MSSHLDLSQYAPDYGWWDQVYEDAKQCAEIIGFEIDDIWFAGFSSQGDGACFAGRLYYQKGASKSIRQHAPRDSELHRIADDWTAFQKKHFYSISGRVKQAGRGSHSGCTSFDWEDARYCYGWTNGAFDEAEGVQIARDFMDWIYDRLEAEYEYQCAWELARAWSELGHEITETRKEARALLSDMRTARKTAAPVPPSICAALHGQLRQLLSRIATGKETRAALAAAFFYTEDSGTGEPWRDIGGFAAAHC